MMSLVLKDFRIQKGQKSLFMAIIISVASIFLFQSGADFAIVFCILPAFYLIQTAQALDFKYGADSLIASLPVSRSKIVEARYLFVLFLAAAGLVPPLFIGILIHFVFPSFIVMSPNFMALAFSAIILMNAISFPFYYRFGYTVSRWASLVFVVLPATLFGILAGVSGSIGSVKRPAIPGLANFRDLMNVSDPGLVLSAVAFAALGFGISLAISLRIYKYKDLQ